MIHTRVGGVDGKGVESSEGASSFGGSILSDLPPTTSSTLDLDLHVRLCGRRDGLHAAIELGQSRGELATRDRASQENASEGDMSSLVGRMVLAQQHARLEQVAQTRHVPRLGAAAPQSSSAPEDGPSVGHGEVSGEREGIGFIRGNALPSPEYIMRLLLCSIVESNAGARTGTTLVNRREGLLFYFLFRPWYGCWCAPVGLGFKQLF